MRRHERPVWWDAAACRGVGPDIFFSDDPEDQAVARGLCACCPVERDCFADALDRTRELADAGFADMDHGLFANTLPADRLRLVSDDLSQYSDTHDLELA